MKFVESADIDLKGVPTKVGLRWREMPTSWLKYYKKYQFWKINNPSIPLIYVLFSPVFEFCVFTSIFMLCDAVVSLTLTVLFWEGFLSCACFATWLAFLADLSLVSFSFPLFHMLSLTALSAELSLLRDFEIIPDLGAGANFFYKSSDSTNLWLRGPYGACHNYWSLLL